MGFKADLIVVSGNNLSVTNYAFFNIQQRLSQDKKLMHRDCTIEAQKLFNYDGEINEGDAVEGVVRLEVGDKEEVKYFTGIMLSLNMGLAKIRLNGELQDDNVKQFLKKIERYEFSR